MLYTIIDVVSVINYFQCYNNGYWIKLAMMIMSEQKMVHDLYIWLIKIETGIYLFTAQECFIFVKSILVLHDFFPNNRQ